MLDRLIQIFKELDEDIAYNERLDHAYTEYYRSLIRKRRAIVRAIKVFEKEDRRWTERDGI